jgi:hypothetical protein
MAITLSEGETKELNATLQRKYSTCYSTPATTGSATSTGCNVLCYPIKACCAYSVAKFKTRLCENPGWNSHNTIEIFIFLAGEDGWPTSQISYGFYQGFSLPPYPDYLDLSFALQPFTFIQGQMYSIGLRLTNDFKLATMTRTQQFAAQNETCPSGLPYGDGNCVLPAGYEYPSTLCLPPSIPDAYPNPTGPHMYYEFL